MLCFQQSFWSKLWFWREVLDDIPLGPEHFRILNPEIVLKTGKALQKFAAKTGGVSFSIQNCYCH